ncbi:MAG: TetR family transcriptional regulator [Proteobacteria bacterium]|nr:MAG: TetR family transcriptional regulator [Pseudomonadota bacterium]
MLKKQTRSLKKTEAGSSKKTAPQRKRVRLLPQARERMILDTAIDFFAEEGFRAQTRGLADRLGVSQSLIYRYFGSKEELIERVYEKTFLSRWNPSWEDTLADRSRPLRERLKDFLRSYLIAVDDRTWIRIAMHSSLEGNNLTRRYIQGPVTRLLGQIALELRGNEAGASEEPSELEIELAWHLHSTVIYYLIRKHIHETPVSLDGEGITSTIVDNFLDGVKFETYRTLCRSHKDVATSKSSPNKSPRNKPSRKAAAPKTAKTGAAKTESARTEAAETEAAAPRRRRA